jgi:hypothetical protein
MPAPRPSFHSRCRSASDRPRSGLAAAGLPVLPCSCPASARRGSAHRVPRMGTGRARPAAGLPAEQAAATLDVTPAAAVPQRRLQPNYRETGNAYQTRTQLRQTPTVTMAAAAASRSAVITDWNSSFSVRYGRSISAPIAAGDRRCGDWPIFQRSSDRCWRPHRIAAARTE